MTDLFLNNLMAIRPESIPADVYRHARACFLDYLACTLAGARYFSKKTTEYLDEMGAEIGVASVLGLGRKASMQTAALVNGLNAHVIELDDGHRKGALHVGATVFSALLPVAEKEGLSAQDLLYGAIIGYETTIRLACAVQPGNKLRGYHATGTCGTVGAAMGIATALHFDFNQMKSTLSAAVTSAAGVLEMQEDNADLKPLNVGRAAMDAVSAAYLGKVRFKAPNDALGGKRGFFKVMTDEPKTQFVTEFAKTSEKMMIEQAYMKSYASCRHTHPAIECALQIRKKDGFRLDAVDSIVVHTYKLAVSGHDHTEILGVSSAKMSMPYSVAVALVTGDAGLNEFSEKYVGDKEILVLAKKVSVVADDEFTALCPSKRAASMEVVCGEKIYSARVDYPKGEPENPLTDEELNQKFRALCGLDADVAEKIVKMVMKEDFAVENLVSICN
ncbi:MmgE/PrpD family protein [Fibrobacter sp.]|uniref:MmgE/PrpD family protein n=1 Tax=Fibrobacter sp. TaxID=35828 RepID=UPI00388E20BE